MSRPDLWDDPEKAKAISGEYANRRDDVTTFDGLASTLDDVEVLHDLAREEEDESQEPRSRRSSTTSAGASTSSSCAACSSASTTTPTRSCRSTPRTAASTPRTSARCFLRMYEGGPSGGASR